MATRPYIHQWAMLYVLWYISLFFLIKLAVIFATVNPFPLAKLSTFMFRIEMSMRLVIITHENSPPSKPCHFENDFTYVIYQSLSYWPYSTHKSELIEADAHTYIAVTLIYTIVMSQ